MHSSFVEQVLYNCFEIRHKVRCWALRGDYLISWVLNSWPEVDHFGLRVYIVSKMLLFYIQSLPGIAWCTPTPSSLFFLDSRILNWTLFLFLVLNAFSFLFFFPPGHKTHAYNLKNPRGSRAGESLSLRLTGLWAPSIWNSIETFFSFCPPSFTVLQIPFLLHLSCFGEFFFFFLTELLNCLTFERCVYVCMYVCMFICVCMHVVAK